VTMMKEVKRTLDVDNGVTRFGHILVGEIVDATSCCKEFLLWRLAEFGFKECLCLLSISFFKLVVLS